MENIEDMSRNLKAITDSLAEDAPRIRRMLIEGEDVLRDTRDIVKGAKTVWPFRLMVPVPRPIELIPLDGYPLEKIKTGDSKND
jgi:hypothetical protein